MNTLECDNSLPKTFFKGTYRWMFGILKISVLIEDRRPDLEVGKYDGKYKTQISVFLFGKRIFSTLARGGGPYYYGHCEASDIDKFFSKEDADTIKSSEKGSVFTVRTSLMSLCNDLDNISPEFNLYSSYGEEDR